MGYSFEWYPRWLGGRASLFLRLVRFGFPGLSITTPLDLSIANGDKGVCTVGKGTKHPPCTTCRCTVGKGTKHPPCTTCRLPGGGVVEIGGEIDLVGLKNKKRIIVGGKATHPSGLVGGAKDRPQLALLGVQEAIGVTRMLSHVGVLSCESLIFLLKYKILYSFLAFPSVGLNSLVCSNCKSKRSVVNE